MSGKKGKGGKKAGGGSASSPNASNASHTSSNTNTITEKSVVALDQKAKADGGGGGPVVRFEMKKWSDASPASPSFCQSLRDALVPKYCVQWVRQYGGNEEEGDRALAAYAARILEVSISPVGTAGGAPSLLSVAEGIRVVAMIDNLWHFVGQRLVSKWSSFAERQSLCLFVGQLLTIGCLPQRSFLTASPSIVSALVEMMRCKDEAVQADFGLAPTEYPWDLICRRFSIQPVDRDRAARLYRSYAEMCRQTASDVLSKFIRLAASRLAEDGNILIDAIKSAPALVSVLVEAAVRPINKYLPHSTLSASAAGSLAVLFSLPYRETETMKLSVKTLERLSLLFPDPEPDWFATLLDYVRSGPKDKFDALMDSIQDSCTPESLKQAGIGSAVNTAPQQATKNLGDLILGLFAVLLSMATVPSIAERVGARLAPIFRFALTRLFYDFSAVRTAKTEAAADRRAQARLRLFMENQSLKNVFDADGSVVWVTTLPEPLVCSVLALYRLCLYDVYSINELEMLMAHIGGLREYLHAAAQKAKQAGNERYSEGMKNGTLEMALSSYSLAIALALPDDAEKHIYFSNRAQVWIERKMWSDAIRDCEEALKLSPDHTKSKSRLEIAIKHQSSAQ